MTAKEYLRQIKYLEIRINDKLSEIETLRAMATRVTVALGDERVQTSLKADKIGNITAKIIEEEKALNYYMQDFVEKRRAIIKQIEELDNSTYTELLFKRYVNYKTFEVISVEMGYSWRQVMNLHSNALKNFGEKYNIS